MRKDAICHESLLWEMRNTKRKPQSNIRRKNGTSLCKRKGKEKSDWLRMPQLWSYRYKCIPKEHEERKGKS